MAKINKKDLVDFVAEQVYLSKKDAEAAIDAAVELITKSLVEGSEVNVSNFGILTPKTRKTRIGTDPKTHEKITLEGKSTIVFRPSKQLKKLINK